MTLDGLVDRVSDIAIGDFATFDFFFEVGKYFKREDVQERMIELNQDRLYERSETHKGQLLPSYSYRTARHKRKVGLPDENYTYYETGRTHDSLEVFVSDDSVMIALGADAPEYAFDLDADAWGLTEAEVEDEFRDELRDYLLGGLREYING